MQEARTQSHRSTCSGTGQTPWMEKDPGQMISFYKSNELMAKADKITLEVPLNAPDLPGPLDLFYFSRLTLAPPVAFEHIAGAGLISFLDECEMTDNVDFSLPLRYVHGSSEVMKGRPSITNVLFAKQNAEIPQEKWMPALPEIWHRFQLIRAKEKI